MVRAGSVLLGGNVLSPDRRPASPLPRRQRCWNRLRVQLSHTAVVSQGETLQHNLNLKGQLRIITSTMTKNKTQEMGIIGKAERHWGVEGWIEELRHKKHKPNVKSVTGFLACTFLDFSAIFISNKPLFLLALLRPVSC